jgi:tetratricopeptide (TPR) repeat protein
MGSASLTWIALASGSYAEALDYSEQSLAVAVAPWERLAALGAKGCSLVLLGQTEEGEKLLQQQRSSCISRGYLYSLLGSDVAIGMCRIRQGDIADGIGWIKEAILRREKEGYLAAADWYRLSLAEVYLQIIAGQEKPPFLTLLKNLPILLNIMVTAPSRIRALIRRVLENPHFDPAGDQVGRANMILGLLYKAKKKRALAVQHLTEAKRILSQFGQTPMLARLEAALAELG